MFVTAREETKRNSTWLEKLLLEIFYAGSTECGRREEACVYVFVTDFFITDFFYFNMKT